MLSAKIRIGMGQLLVEGGEPERNLARAEELVMEASRSGCHIILLPECSDLAWSHPSAKTKAESIPGKRSDFFSYLAVRENIYIAVGLTEKHLSQTYNTAVLINPAGNIILKYRKINILKIVQDIYQIGDSLSVVHTPFGIIGMNICSDNYIDSLNIGQVLGRMGARIVLSPSSWTVDYYVTNEGDPYKEKWEKPYSVLAQLFDLVVVSATSVGYLVGGPYEGKKSVGCSIAVGKDGIIAMGNFNEIASELVIAEFNIPQPITKGTELVSILKEKGYKESFGNLIW